MQHLYPVIFAAIALLSVIGLSAEPSRPSSGYSAKVIADSVARGVRLITLEVCFPRFILAEFNTHRMLSRNSASSRAIPVKQRLAQVWSNPFIPEAFGVNKSGMQASSNLGGWQAWFARKLWLIACRCCCIVAWFMIRIDVHKQHANRVIELWAWHQVVVSGTEWENFYALRVHPAAQPEMQITARLMRDAMNASKPVERHNGEWHLPYVTETERDEHGMETCQKLSAVRCAAVSYERQHVAREIEAVVKRYDSSKNSGHWSPFEHVAVVESEAGFKHSAKWRWDAGRDEFVPDSIGNFAVPWRQLRKLYSGEAVFHG